MRPACIHGLNTAGLTRLNLTQRQPTGPVSVAEEHQVYMKAAKAPSIDRCRQHCTCLQLHAIRCFMSSIHLHNLGAVRSAPTTRPSPHLAVKPRQRSPPNRLAYRWRLSYNVHASHHVLYAEQVDGDAMAVLLRPNGPSPRSVIVYGC